VMKMEGTYHGMSDIIENDLLGVSKAAYSDLIQGKYNDTEVTKDIILAHKDELACVIVAIDPGDLPTEDFLKMLRETTEKHGVVFVLDEVVTFRLSYGGGQEMFNIRPDLTATGKVVGGGFPIGVFGGRPDIMKVFSPDEPESAHHSGTFAATPVSIVAGIASLEILDREAIARINGLGDLMANRLRATMDELDITGQASNTGSLVSMSLTPPGMPSEKAPLYRGLSGALAHLLLTKGIFSLFGAMFAISTPMTEKDVEEAVKAVQESLVEMKPVINEIAQG